MVDEPRDGHWRDVAGTVPLARGDGTGAPGDGDDAITERGAAPGEDANHRDKKTQRWLDGLHDIAGAASELSGKTRVVSVMDREADFFEPFDEQRRLHRTEVLVRAKHDRCLGKGASKLFATMRNAEPCGHVEIEIDRVSERRKSSRKKARPARSKRLALAEVHYRKLVVPATHHQGSRTGPGLGGACARNRTARR